MVGVGFAAMIVLLSGRLAYADSISTPAVERKVLFSNAWKVVLTVSLSEEYSVHNCAWRTG